MARPLLHTCPLAVCPAAPLSARWTAAVCVSDAAPFAPGPLSRLARALRIMEVEVLPLPLPFTARP